MIKDQSISTRSTSVSCNGAAPPLDHPRIYLELDPKQGWICCPYCGTKFILKDSI